MENLEDLVETPRRVAIHAHFFDRFITQPSEQFGGVAELLDDFLPQPAIKIVAAMIAAMVVFFMNCILAGRPKAETR